MKATSFVIHPLSFVLYSLSFVLYPLSFVPCLSHFGQANYFLLIDDHRNRSRKNCSLRHDLFQFLKQKRKIVPADHTLDD